MSDISFMPHGQCMMWNLPLVLIHVVGDILIALAYFSIPIALYYFMKRREDLPFKYLYFLFAAFIFSCGVTHVFTVVTLWQPVYWVEGGLKLLTAGVSIATAFALWPAIPLALRIPSSDQLKKVNDDLRDQVRQRESAEAQLKELNQILKESLSEEEKKARTALSEMEKMQEELITVCAWSKRIQDQGEWISFEEFMARHFKLNFTHGISEEAMKEVRGQIEEARKNQKPGKSGQ